MQSLLFFSFLIFFPLMKKKCNIMSWLWLDFVVLYMYFSCKIIIWKQAEQLLCLNKGELVLDHCSEPKTLCGEQKIAGLSHLSFIQCLLITFYVAGRININHGQKLMVIYYCSLSKYNFIEAPHEYFSFSLFSCLSVSLPRLVFFQFSFCQYL